jgi:hypothetical protein
VIDPERISVLDKGQRSVKGLASGFENIVTADLVLSMCKAAAGEAMARLNAPPNSTATAVDEALAEGAATPTYVYLGVVRSYIRQPR